MSARLKKGFTLIELIVVIVLIAIVSVYASSRYFGASSVDLHLIRSELLSSIRLTQLRAMHRNGLCNRWMVGSNEAVQISPEREVDDCLSVIFPSDREDSSFVDLASYDATMTLTTTTSSFIDFDTLGRPLQCNTTPNGRCELQVQTQSGQAFSICINTEGGISGC
jgi:MSHA pilin protein MshC